PSITIFLPAPQPPTSPLSLHDALPIFASRPPDDGERPMAFPRFQLSRHNQRRMKHVRERVLWWLAYPFYLVASLFRETGQLLSRDRKSTRLNSSHDQISYAVFCLIKKV